MDVRLRHSVKMTCCIKLEGGGEVRFTVRGVEENGGCALRGAGGRGGSKCRSVDILMQVGWGGDAGRRGPHNRRFFSPLTWKGGANSSRAKSSQSSKRNSTNPGTLNQTASRETLTYPEHPLPLSLSPSPLPAQSRDHTQNPPQS